MKKYILLSTAMVALSMPAHASDWYASGSIGITKTKDADINVSGVSGDVSFDNAANFSAALGKEITDKARAELELSYRKTDLDNLSALGVSGDVDGDLKTTALMVNGYYDVMSSGKISPYLTAGLGLAKHSVSTTNTTLPGPVVVTGLSDDDTVIAYKLGAGVDFKAGANTSVFTQYNYFDTADMDFSTTEADYGAHEIKIGARYSF